MSEIKQNLKGFVVAGGIMMGALTGCADTEDTPLQTVGTQELDFESSGQYYCPGIGNVEGIVEGLSLQDSIDFMKQAIVYSESERLFFANNLNMWILGSRHGESGEFIDCITGKGGLVRLESGEIAIATIEHNLEGKGYENSFSPIVFYPRINAGGEIEAAHFSIEEAKVKYINPEDEGKEEDAPILIIPPEGVQRNLQVVESDGLINPSRLATEFDLYDKEGEENFFVFLNKYNQVVILDADASQWDHSVSLPTIRIDVVSRDSRIADHALRVGDSGSPMYRAIFDEEGGLDFDSTFSGEVQAIVRSGYNIEGSGVTESGVAAMIGGLDLTQD